jgi:hypothetical protein
VIVSVSLELHFFKLLKVELLVFLIIGMIKIQSATVLPIGCNGLI